MTPRIISNYYDKLLNELAVGGYLHKSQPQKISASTIKDVKKILSPAFNLAMIWGETTYNPTLPVKLPKRSKFVRSQWTENEVVKALTLCDDPLLHAVISVHFSATTRTGELCALTWDCVDISEGSIVNGTAHIRITKTLERISKIEAEKTNDRGILFKFPSIANAMKTIVVLKEPKTIESKRNVYLPTSVVAELQSLKIEQNKLKKILGKEYHDYNLVFAQENGNPYEPKVLSKIFKRFIKKYGLREVDLYSLRHSGASVKLSITRDLKGVQGDMGHADAQMLTKVYATIIDEDRKKNAVAIEERVYSKNDLHNKKD